MKPGTIVRINNFTHQFNSGKASASYKLDKGKVAVMMILGVEDKACEVTSNDHYTKMVEKCGFKAIEETEEVDEKLK